MRSRVGSANARNMTLMRRTALVARVSTFVAVAARPFTSLASVRVERRRARGGGLHHGRVLVHGVHLVREPGRDLGALAYGHIAGIRPSDVPGFIVVQLFGAAAATGLFRWLVPSLPAVAPRVVAKGTERGAAGKSRMTTVIFTFVHNAGRSQMAAAFFKRSPTPRRLPRSPPVPLPRRASTRRLWPRCARSGST